MRHLVTPIFATTLMAVLALSGPACAQVAVANDHLIIPGVRAGPFVLGMTEDDLLKVGHPSARGSVTGKMTATGQRWDAVGYCYYGEHVCAYVAGRPGKVVDIWVGYDGDCRGYHTTENQGCGISLGKAETSLLWGEPISAYINTYGDESLKGRIMIAYFRNANAFTKLEFVTQNWSEASPISNQVQWIDIVDVGYDHFHRPGD